MTVRFANEMKKRLKCATCSDKAMPARRFCFRHLEYARLRWHDHVHVCKLEGRCIRCQRKHVPGEQRCRGCKEENRANCRRWWRENKARLTNRRRARIEAGLCGSCGLRRHVPGHTDCLTCHPRGYRS